jgi:hypothetical protein
MIFSKYSSFQSFLDGTNETFYFFSFLSSGMACAFQISKMKIQKISFSCGGMTNFLFKFQNKKSFQISKTIFFPNLSWWNKRIFFSIRDCQIYLKFTKINYLSLQK